jgi:hypothetical protein
MENRILDRFLDRTGKTLFFWKTCRRTCFLYLNPILPSYLNHGPEKACPEKSVEILRQGIKTCPSACFFADRFLQEENEFLSYNFHI